MVESVVSQTILQKQIGIEDIIAIQKYLVELMKTNKYGGAMNYLSTFNVEIAKIISCSWSDKELRKLLGIMLCSMTKYIRNYLRESDYGDLSSYLKKLSIIQGEHDVENINHQLFKLDQILAKVLVSDSIRADHYWIRSINLDIAMVWDANYIPDFALRRIHQKLAIELSNPANYNYFESLAKINELIAQLFAQYTYDRLTTFAKMKYQISCLMRDLFVENACVKMNLQKQSSPEISLASSEEIPSEITFIQCGWEQNQKIIRALLEEKAKNRNSILSLLEQQRLLDEKIRFVQLIRESPKEEEDKVDIQSFIHPSNGMSHEDPDKKISFVINYANRSGESSNSPVGNQSDDQDAHKDVEAVSEDNGSRYDEDDQNEYIPDDEKDAVDSDGYVSSSDESKSTGDFESDCPDSL